MSELAKSGQSIFDKQATGEEVSAKFLSELANLQESTLYKQAIDEERRTAFLPALEPLSLFDDI
jgi:hypothetical protein